MEAKFHTHLNPCCLAHVWYISDMQRPFVTLLNKNEFLPLAAVA